MDRDSAKSQIANLVEKYNEVAKDKDGYNRYNEEMTKLRFINPLFQILGWDIENKNRKDEVTFEDRVSKGRVDYGFRINGIPKFFLEAKALKVNIDSPEYARQAIDYAWNKGCTWAVLTDFETIKIFNAEWRTSDYSQSHLKTIYVYEFLDRFDELWLLSKESFEKSLMDKEAERWGKKRRKTTVDKQLLADFTKFRGSLSKNIIKLNSSKQLSGKELDESVQRILDRLIFIRYCEDRELEERKLISNLREWEGRGRGQLIKNLREVFAYFDQHYNSKIFASHLCDDLDIDNEVLHEIIEGLHYVKDKSISYDFSAIEADVLGNIYEQYLGHILTKTERRATLKESQTHRKEQGIFYTPTFIVDYIVRHTVNRLVQQKGQDYRKVRILDLACGSGSFLIKAFDVLDEYYSKRDKDYAQTALDLTVENGTYTKRLQILQNHIFGVDLDKQAVEVAQLNLLLKVAEKGRRLPLLQKNIRQGNSLIDESLVQEDMPLKWQEEFADIIHEGGFDIIIGNPPYIRQETLGDQKVILERKYATFDPSADIFVYFIERGMSLLKNNGYLGFVVSNRWLRANYGKPLRKWLKEFEICEIIDFGSLRVFQDAKTYPCIMILRKAPAKTAFEACQVTTLNFQSLERYVDENKFLVNQSHLQDSGWSLMDKSADGVLAKIKNKGSALGKQFSIHYGIKTGLNAAFVIDEVTKERLISENPRCSELIKPLATGRDVKRYGNVDPDKFIIVIPHRWTRAASRDAKDTWKWLEETYSPIARHLKPFEKDAMRRYDKGEFWWELRPCDYYDKFSQPKIIYPRINNKPSFTLDERGCFLPDTAFFIASSSEYLLGILNSKLMRFYSMHSCSMLIGGYYEYRYQYVEQFPIAPAKDEVRTKIESLVRKRLDLEEKVDAIGEKATDERKRFEEEIQKIETSLDELIYGVYGITNEDKRVIESEIQRRVV